jgi:hypothetical protein
MTCCVCGREGTRGFRVVPAHDVTIPDRGFGGGTQRIPEHVFCTAKKACWARKDRLPCAAWARANLEAMA